MLAGAEPNVPANGVEIGWGLSFKHVNGEVDSLDTGHERGWGGDRDKVRRLFGTVACGASVE